jgi:O-antigen ligase
MTFMTTLGISNVKALDRRSLEEAADWLVVGVAISLPWSTSATGILIALWLLVFVPTLTFATVRRELATPAGGLPVALWLLALVGLLWADTSWMERFAGLGGFNRLLVLPLLLAQFRRSKRGFWVLYGFLASVFVLMLLSWALILTPGLSWRGSYGVIGVPVKSYILQSAIFLICAVVLLDRAFEQARAKNWRPVAVLSAVAVLFLANIFFVAFGRTTLLVAPVLALLLGWRQFGLKGVVGACVLGVVLSGALWFESPYLRQRLTNSVVELDAYRAKDAVNSTALHLEFLRKSWSFVESAPVIGHGTGSIPEQFRLAAAGQTGSAGAPSVNPHNQIFAVAIQLGLVGAAVLIAMWIAHVMLFCGATLTEWVGMVIVVDDVVSSLVNSYLFDFTQGWMYVFGVGVCGGMVRQARNLSQPGAPPRATAA